MSCPIYVGSFTLSKKLNVVWTWVLLLVGWCLVVCWCTMEIVGVCCVCICEEVIVFDKHYWHLMVFVGGRWCLLENAWWCLLENVGLTVNIVFFVLENLLVGVGVNWRILVFNGKILHTRDNCALKWLWQGSVNTINTNRINRIQYRNAVGCNIYLKSSRG